MLKDSYTWCDIHHSLFHLPILSNFRFSPAFFYPFGFSMGKGHYSSQTCYGDISEDSLQDLPQFPFLLLSSQRFLRRIAINSQFRPTPRGVFDVPTLYHISKACDPLSDPILFRAIFLMPFMASSGCQT